MADSGHHRREPANQKINQICRDLGSKIDIVPSKVGEKHGQLFLQDKTFELECIRESEELLSVGIAHGSQYCRFELDSNNQLIIFYSTYFEKAIDCQKDGVEAVLIHLEQYKDTPHIALTRLMLSEIGVFKDISDDGEMDR